MTLTRALCGLAALAGTAAPAAAQLAVMPAPRGPNRVLYTAPPWITNGLRPGAVPAAAAPAPVGRVPEVNEVRPNWTGPTIQAVAAPGAVVAPPVVKGPELPAIPPAPAVRPAAGEPGAIVVPATAPIVTATYMPPVAARPAARPTPPATAAQPDVWKRAGSPVGTSIPATLPGTTVPAPRGR